MESMKRMHPEWLELVKIVLCGFGLGLFVLAASLYLLSDDPIMQAFNHKVLLSIAKSLSIVGISGVVIGVVVVCIEHWLCNQYCIGWKNHKP